MNNVDTLLVEGKSDQEFFRFLLQNDNLLNHIEISPPKPLGSDNDGITGILEILPNLLQFKIFGGNLGIILDADYQANQKGFAVRRSEVTEILNDFGYEASTPNNNTQWNGEFFTHNEGLTPVGLWIMPDHHSDGMLETLLLDTVKAGNRQQLLERLQQEIEAVSNLEQFQEIRFKGAHKNKILLNTWLNWQKQPAACKSDSISIIECALQQDWLDANHPNVASLVQWLKRVFAANDNN